MLIHDPIIRSARARPLKTALSTDDLDLTYSQLVSRIFSCSRVLEKHVHRGDRVLILLSDKAKYLVALYGLSLRGAIAVPLADDIAETTLSRIVADCEPRAAITSSRDLRRHSRNSALKKCRLISLDDELTDESVGTLTDAAPLRVKETDPALILYTSGTTVKQKGVLLSHRNLNQATLNINKFMRINSEIQEYVTVPLSHSFGFGRVRCVLEVGGTLVVRNGHFNPAAPIKSLSTYACNAISWVPAGFALCLRHFEQELEESGHLLRWTELGSASIPVEHKRRLRELFPHARICMHYGLTEASRSTFLELREDQQKEETVGQPSPNVEIRIADEQGNTLSTSQSGEICVRGEHVAGYWRNDELNGRCSTKDGFFRTGDYGFEDKDGYIHLLGRKDEIINMGGIKISPLEIEEAVRSIYPHLKVCVLGVPDPEGLAGDLPALCYVGRGDGKLNLPDLHRKLASRLERSKLPRILYKIDAIPETESGKIRRNELLQRLRLVAQQRN